MFSLILGKNTNLETLCPPLGISIIYGSLWITVHGTEKNIHHHCPYYLFQIRQRCTVSTTTQYHSWTEHRLTEIYRIEDECFVTQSHSPWAELRTPAPLSEQSTTSSAARSCFGAVGAGTSGAGPLSLGWPGTPCRTCPTARSPIHWLWDNEGRESCSFVWTTVERWLITKIWVTD